MGSSVAQNVLFESLYEGQSILIHNDIADAASRYIRSRLDSGDILNISNVLLPGFIVFCFSSDQKIREWGWRSVKMANNKNVLRPASSMIPIFASVLRKLVGRLDTPESYHVSSKEPSLFANTCTFEFCLQDVWKGLRVALCRLSSKTKEGIVDVLDGFATILCGYLIKIDGTEFVDALRAFAEVIAASESATVWPNIEQIVRVTPSSFVKMALNHSAVMFWIRKKTPDSASIDSESLKRQDMVLRPVLDWVTPFAYSLDLPRDTPALTTLLGMLLIDFCQDPDVPPTHSIIFVHIVIAIIKHCLKLPKAKKFDSNGMFILADFLNQNIDHIVLIAQGHSQLSQCERLIVQAEDLIDALLRENLDNTFEAVTQTVEAAQGIREDPESVNEIVANIEEVKPTFILFPALLSAILQNPRNVEIVHKSLFAASFLLLFDEISSGLVEYLPSDWKERCSRFNVERNKIVNMAQSLLQLLAERLDAQDAPTRVTFEADSLTTFLRFLISPSKPIHPVVLGILRGGTLDSEFGEPEDRDDVSQGAEAFFSEQEDSEREMICYALFDRHKEQFITSLTEVAKNCRMLVNNNRPAYTCAHNVALLASSSISAVSGLIDTGSSEAIAMLFFEFCGLLGSILKTSSGSEVLTDNWDIYEKSVLAVFRTVYGMLNAIEFSYFVRQVKSKEHLNESDTVGALSTCLAQMFSYLEGPDKLKVASEIIQTFGLVASGLAATVGTSMLYPVETVQGLVNGRTGHLSLEQRRHLKSITSMSVWEPRSIAISKSTPVKIIMDDAEEEFALLNDDDFDGILDYSMDMGDQPSAVPKSTTAFTETSIDDFNKRASALTIGDDPQPTEIKKQIDDSSDDDVVEVQLNAQDMLAAARRSQQTSMDRWFTSKNTQSGTSLTSQLSQRKAAAAASSRGSGRGSSISTRAKKSGDSNVMQRLRKDAINERQLWRQKVVAVPNQIVNAPRSMSTALSSKMSAVPKLPVDVPASVPPPMYVRNSSKAAIAEMKKADQMAASRIVQVDSDDSDLSISEDEGASGLAGLFRKSTKPASNPPKRTTKMVWLSGTAPANRGNFFDQPAHDKAAEERKAKARLRPSMSLLHKHILSWPFESSADIPPSLQSSSLIRIPDKFRDCDEYIETLEPLMILESWAQLQSAKEEAAFRDVGEAILDSSMSIDAFHEITFEVNLGDLEDLAEHDVIVFVESIDRDKLRFLNIPNPVRSTRTSASNKNSAERFAGRKTFLGMVKSRVFKRGSGQIVVRACFEGVRLATFMNMLVNRSTWEFVKLFSATPVHREYAALRSLPYLNEKLVEEILHPRGHGVSQALSQTEVVKCMKVHALNQPQAEAVTTAIKRDHGFTLIQGPPGTGKTKTILGLAGALLQQAKQKPARNQDLSDVGIKDSSDAGARPNNKLMICAPSNAAVDEIVKRLKCGIRDDNGETFFPRVVRVGQSSNVSSTVRDTTLDFLLRKALDSFSDSSDQNKVVDSKDISQAQTEMLLDVAGRTRREGKDVTHAIQAKENKKSADESLRVLRKKCDEINKEIAGYNRRMDDTDPSDLQAVSEIQELIRKAMKNKRELQQKLNNESARAREATRTLDATKHKVRLQILQKTDILCCTLSGSGHEMLTSLGCTFDTVIIDEAAQSIELSCLIPLKYDCKRCILVGDPQQLPPTVLSQTASKLMYNQSMFVRIQKNAPKSVNLL
ncbi:DEAD-box type RNA helicase, partial [Coemansia sp. RSA 1722]